MELVKEKGKLAELQKMTLQSCVLKEVLELRGMQTVKPTSDLLKLFSLKLYGHQWKDKNGNPKFTARRFFKLFDGRSEPTVSEARLLSWYFDVDFSLMCYLTEA